MSHFPVVALRSQRCISVEFEFLAKFVDSIDAKIALTAKNTMYAGHVSTQKLNLRLKVNQHFNLYIRGV
jgi:hypothetical protein